MCHGETFDIEPMVFGLVSAENHLAESPEQAEQGEKNADVQEFVEVFRMLEQQESEAESEQLIKPGAPHGVNPSLHAAHFRVR